MSGADGQELEAIAVWTTPDGVHGRLEGIAPNMKTAQFHMETFILPEYRSVMDDEQYRDTDNSVQYETLRPGYSNTQVAFEVWFTEHDESELGDVQAFYEQHKAEWQA